MVDMSKLTKQQVDDFNKSQQNPMFHPFTCMSYDGCNRDKQLNYGSLIATEDGIKCPCGKYTQEYPSILPPKLEEMDLPPLFCDIIKKDLDN